MYPYPCLCDASQSELGPPKSQCEMKMCHFESRRCARRENVCRTACQDEVWAPCTTKLQMVIYGNRPWHRSHYYSDAPVMIGLDQVWRREKECYTKYCMLLKMVLECI